MLDYFREEPKIIEVGDCVHGQPSIPSYRSIGGNVAFHCWTYARVRCKYSIPLIAWITCISTEFGRSHR
jgi:hypothetical protein